MSWAMGLSLWIIGGGVVALLFGQFAARGRGEEWDHVADRKRRTERRARHLSREFK